MRILASDHVLKLFPHGNYLLTIAVLSAADFLLMRFDQILHLLLVSGHGLENALLDCIVSALFVILLHSVDLDNVLIFVRVCFLLIGDLRL